MKAKKVLLSALALALLSTAPATVSWAASGQKIGNVRLNVKNRLEPGSSIGRDGVILGEPAKGELGIWETADAYDLESVRVTSGFGENLAIGTEIGVEAVIRTTGGGRTFSTTLGAGDVHLSDNSVTITDVRRSKQRLIVSLCLSGIKGEYAEPEQAEWKSGQTGVASWRAPSNTSGSYEVVLRRGNEVVKRAFGITGESYNFYPYMTKPGYYSFRVRTEAKGTGKASGWTESGSMRISAQQVSDGRGAVWDKTGGPTGETNNVVKAGWILNGDSWSYRYPDGSFKKDGWEQIEGKWYLFNSEGKMRTGWARTVSGWYYFAESGEMLTGWQNVNGVMYYLNPDADSPTYGKMAANELIMDGNKFYYALADGQRAKGWVQLGDHWGYFYPESGEMARNTTIDTFYVDASGAWKR